MLIREWMTKDVITVTPDTSMPVSYTHLDVYKRQGKGRAVGKRQRVHAGKAREEREALLKNAARGVGAGRPQRAESGVDGFLRVQTEGGLSLIHI